MDAKNLLILMSDEHDPRYMGCADHPFVKTPNMDRLAESGTRFETAYTPCPICVPARGSFATGRHVHETGCWDNAHGYDGSTPGWGQRLIDTGHRVESIGKLHYKSA
ncbi:MAG: sulfatase-like hydrolase/transferase, partial [Pseudomonadota bacterium]|nr:sulfatase-like hydrolase/transferase [Pseudomonadota bacterium]